MFAGRVATEEKHVGRKTEESAQEEQIDHVLQELEIERDSHSIGREICLPLTLAAEMDASSRPAAGVLSVH